MAILHDCKSGKTGQVFAPSCRDQADVHRTSALNGSNLCTKEIMGSSIRNFPLSDCQRTWIFRATWLSLWESCHACGMTERAKAPYFPLFAGISKPSPASLRSATSPKGGRQGPFLTRSNGKFHKELPIIWSECRDSEHYGVDPVKPGSSRCPPDICIGWFESLREKNKTERADALSVLLVRVSRFELEAS